MIWIQDCEDQVFSFKVTLLLLFVANIVSMANFNIHPPFACLYLNVSGDPGALHRKTAAADCGQSELRFTRFGTTGGEP